MELTREYMAYYHKVNDRMNVFGKLPVVLKNTEDEIFIPKRKHPSDAGFDCRARIGKAVTIAPGGRAIIPLGFGINIPMHHTGDLRPRSGLTADYGLMVGYGTIDAGYTGEVKATIFNFGESDFTIEPKDRIAQLVLLPLAKAVLNDSVLDLELTDSLIELERGEGGHGSTGVK